MWCGAVAGSKIAAAVRLRLSRSGCGVVAVDVVTTAQSSDVHLDMTLQSVSILLFLSEWAMIIMFFECESRTIFHLTT